MRRIYRYLRPYWLQLVPVVVGCAVEMAFNAQLPLSIKFLIDRAIAGHDGAAMLQVLALLAAGGLLAGVAGLARDYYYSRVISYVVADLREAMFTRMQKLSLDYFARTSGGDIVSRFSNDLAAAEAGMAAGVAWGVQPALDVAVSIAMIFLLDWRLAMASLLLSPLVLLGPRLFAARAEAASERKQELESHVVTAVQENVAAAAVVRAYGMQAREEERFQAQNLSLRGAMVRLGVVRSVMERSTDFATLLLEVTGVGVAGYMAYSGAISVGAFVSFQTLFRTMSHSVKWLAQFVPTVAATSGGLNRIEQFTAETPSVRDAEGAAEAPAFAREIAFRDARFSYTGEMTNLDGVSLTIARGSSVAFVGASGSGKSTMVNLLLRFYDPSGGAVLWDGLDFRSVTQASLHAQMAAVFQENFLFNTTVRENIRMGRPGATDAEVEEAARAAEIHDVVARLPQGYETLCGERGSRFSGGQRQRIAIARALLRRPAILILDEATSALDPGAEAALNATFERLARGRTVISVTHRLRTVTGVDRIFVMDQGRLAEAGTHAELLLAGGVYARMWHKQQGVHLDATTGRASVEAALLGQLPLLATARMETLAEVAGWFATERFDDGATIVRQGDAGDRMYIIARGTVDVLARGRKPLARLSDGDYFGELALLDDEPRNATVVAVGPCVCLSLQREYFQALLEREPAMRAEVERVAALRAGRAPA